MEKYTARPVGDFAQCRAFVEGFSGDADFADPMLITQEQVENNLIAAIDRPDTHQVLGIFQNGEMAGLFVFLILPGEKYGEMLVGLSRERGAYAEMLEYVKAHFPGYGVDFVFNPRNALIKECLAAAGAVFEPEQQKMVLGEPTPEKDTDGIEELSFLSPQYVRQYFAIHRREGYWTGEKVTSAPDRFRVYLAIHENKVVGYLDVTHCFAENEPYDFFVLPEFRKMGYGRKLLSRAVEENKPSGMMLLVDVGDAAVIRLYRSVGFHRADAPNSQAARLQVPEDAAITKIFRKNEKQPAIAQM